MRLSKSKVLQFAKCPRAFQYSSIDKRKAKVTPPQLKKGIEVHDLLEQFYLSEGNTADEKFESLKKNPKFAEYQGIMLNFLMWNRDIEREQGTLIIPEEAETKYFCKELNFSGIVDRVDQDGKYVAVIDYKTGKVRPMDGYRYELAMYAYLIEQLTPLKVDFWGILWVEHNCKLDLESASREEILKAVTYTEEIREEIKSCVKKKFFPKKPSYLCNWCTWKQDGACNAEDDGQ